MENFKLKYFLGANSCEVFCSFFEKSYLPDGEWRAFIIKGGPGTGKSSFIKYFALKAAEKGYNPVNQIVGYIMSGDPTYITSYKGARNMIMKVERDELVEEMLAHYIESNGWEVK